MVTVFVYNNDVQGALRTLKKEQQREGTFRYVKAKHCFKSSRLKRKERLIEIIRRKLKESSEKIARVQTENIKAVITPFVFEAEGYTVRVFDDGRVVCFNARGRLILKSMIEEFDFDNISSNKKDKQDSNSVVKKEDLNSN
jgi:ribosomal protein S21